jgi:hypothetical protein
MVWILNKSERPYNIGGTLVIPLVPIQISDDYLNNARVKEIMADGDIETIDAPSSSSANETNKASGDNKPATNIPVESGKQPIVSKPTHDNIPPIPTHNTSRTTASATKQADKE